MWIASLLLAMTIFFNVITRLLIAEVIHRKRNFIILDCFANARNDDKNNTRNDGLKNLVITRVLARSNPIIIKFDFEI